MEIHSIITVYNFVDIYYLLLNHFARLPDLNEVGELQKKGSFFQRNWGSLVLIRVSKL